MRDLIAPDRHVLAAHDRDVAELQERIAEKSVGSDLLAERLDLPLVRRDALEPGNRRDHREQRVELGDFGHAGLQEDRRLLRIDAGGEPDRDHLVACAADFIGSVEIGRICVEIGDLEESVGRVRVGRPLREHADEMAEMKIAGGTHARHHARTVRSWNSFARECYGRAINALRAALERSARAARTAGRTVVPRANSQASAIARVQPVPCIAPAMRGPPKISTPAAVASASAGSPSRWPPFSRTAAPPRAQQGRGGVADLRAGDRRAS